MTAPDVEAVLAIQAGSPEAATWSREAYERILSDPAQGAVLVAEMDGNTMGFICFRVVAREAELLNLAVRSDFRRQGTGFRLVEQALQEMAHGGAREIFLEVRDSNRAAIELYQRFGFELQSRRPGYYGHPPADALILHRRAC